VPNIGGGANELCPKFPTKLLGEGSTAPCPIAPPMANVTRKFQLAP